MQFINVVVDPWRCLNVFDSILCCQMFTSRRSDFSVPHQVCFVSHQNNNLLLNETIVSEIDQDMLSQLKAFDVIHRHHQQQSLRIVGLNQVLQSYLSVTVVYEEKMTLLTINRDSNIFLNGV